MGMLELVVRSRLGRDGNNHTSSSLVTHKDLYKKYIYTLYIYFCYKVFLIKVKSIYYWL